VSRIFQALTVAHHTGVDKLKSLSPAGREPTDGSSEVLPTVVVPSNADLFGRLKNQTVQFPDAVNLSHKKIRNYLILAFFVTALVLLGTNHAFHPHGSAFANSQAGYGVTFEGTVRPASEIQITAESTGTVANISVKVGDTVQKGQQLLSMDDREAQLTVKQASVELEAAETKLDKFRVQLADADARVAISQRQEQLVPTRQCSTTAAPRNCSKPVSLRNKSWMLEALNCAWPGMTWKTPKNWRLYQRSCRTIRPIRPTCKPRLLDRNYKGNCARPR